MIDNFPKVPVQNAQCNESQDEGNRIADRLPRYILQKLYRYSDASNERDWPNNEESQLSYAHIHPQIIFFAQA